MSTIRPLTILLLFCLTAKTSAGQLPPIVGKGHPIYQLESRLMNGDKTALFDLAPYFDSTKKVTEFLGYHNIVTTESNIAKRVVSENCLFTDGEFSITDSVTTKQFSNFLYKNRDKIVFSELATSFLITPLDKRTTNFEIRAVSETRKQALQGSAKTLLSPIWLKNNKIDSLIAQRNPISLLLIASELFKVRTRFNRHPFHVDEFTNLLQYLTESEIGVENENHKISWHIDKDYNPASKLSLLIYFSKFYPQYLWNEKKSVFATPGNEIKPIGKEEQLFELLNSKNDSIAMDAFTQLTVRNPSKVTQLAGEYQSADIDKNHSIPIFPYRFLKQLVLLTDYCMVNNIDFVGTKELQHNISQLQTKLSFTKRRKLEDKLIKILTLEDITAFEYWALIHQQSWDLTYSAGRILDIFYSENWNKLTADKKHLNCYLKKSALFDNLGIVGTCNNYPVKFHNSGQSTLTILEHYQTNDSDVKRQIEKIISLNTTPVKEVEEPISWEGNTNYEVKDLEKTLSELTKNVQDSSKTDDAISDVLSQITYSQIPAALAAIENYPFQTDWKKYSFMVRDWGFFMAGNFNEKETREEFLKIYSKLSEYQLYAYYLDQADIHYKTIANELDYDKIYELLKHDVVVAFAGGGGGTQDNEVYALVKLLELTFKTTLGFPNKLCNSNNIYGCNSGPRAKSWMQYMAARKLLKQQHNEP